MMADVSSTADIIDETEPSYFHNIDLFLSNYDDLFHNCKSLELITTAITDIKSSKKRPDLEGITKKLENKINKDDIEKCLQHMVDSKIIKKNTSGTYSFIKSNANTIPLQPIPTVDLNSTPVSKCESESKAEIDRKVIIDIVTAVKQRLK